MTPVVERLRAGVACLLLTAAVFVQRPGLLVPDTKLDLSVDPLDLLARGLHLWDPEGGAGQLQNQAYGYLFPMGPFFALLQGAGLPAWSVQRLWQALVLVVAFLGVRALAARLELGTPGTRLLAAAAYALAPRPLAQLGAISIEVWPYALAPWVLVPLVTGSLRGSPRRAALRSGLAVLCVGGVNAAATLAVVPLGVLWLATRAPGPRRRALAAWWAVAVGLATAWWLGPLLLLGRYSPPFLDVIESAATTTRVTGLWGVLTGNDLWQQYLAVGSEPVRPAGFLLVTVPSLVLCTTALAALGLLALLRRTTPHRGFLAGGVLLGVVVVAAGHVGLRPAGGLERDLLDAALAPFRNVHKYDLLLRLPLCLGLASLAAEVRRPQLPVPALRRPAAVLVVLALVGAAAPLVRVQQPGAFPAVPDHWQQVADWLADRGSAASGRAMVVPAAQSGTYAWGRPGDEPLQPLARSPWVVRDAVPLGGPGTTRVLDVVEEVLQSGRGSLALPAFLRRAGVRYLVVRNDLDSRVTGTRPAVVHAALAASQMVRVRAFGPDVGLDPQPGQGSVDSGLSQSYPSVEVFAVGGSARLVSALPRAGTQRVSGGPESLLPLLDAGVVADRTPVRLAGEDPLPGDERELRTVTDGYRDRETNVGRAGDPASATLGADVDLAFDRPVHDYLPVPAPGHRTTAEVAGFASVTASSSAAQADALLARGRDHHPVAAFDGNGSTSWVTGGLEPLGQWVEARTARPVVLERVVVATPLVVGTALQLTRVRLTTDGGSVTASLRDGRAELRPPPGRTKRVRLTVEGVGNGFGPARFGVVGLDAAVERAGGAPLVADRVLRVPPDAAVATGGRPAAGAAAVVLTAGRRDRPGCLPVGLRPRCSADLPLGDEDDAAVDRVVVLDRPATYTVSVAARPRAGAALEMLLQATREVQVTGAAVVPDPARRAANVLDGDLSTSWVALPGDLEPALLLSWVRPRPVTGFAVRLDPLLPASTPLRLRVSQLLPGGKVGPDDLVDVAGGVGFLTRPLSRVTGLLVRFPPADVSVKGDLRLDGGVAPLPVGVSELVLFGSPEDPVTQALEGGARALEAVRPVLAACGDGPDLEVDGTVRVRTRLVARVVDVLAAQPLQVEACGPPLRLAAGEHRLRLARTATVQPTGLTLRPAGRAAPRDVLRTTEVVRWGASDRRVDVLPGPESWLVVRENANPGWQATLDGRRLAPARLDGWQQAFLVPAGQGGQVRLRFAPDRPYRAALVAGAVLAGLLLLLLALPGRPGPEPGAERPPRAGLVRLLTGGAVVLATGVVGAGLLGLAVVARRLAPGRAHAALLPVGVAALVGAGAAVALRPWPDPLVLSRPLEVVCAVAVAALAVSLWPAPAPATPAARPAPAPGP